MRKALVAGIELAVLLLTACVPIRSSPLRTVTGSGKTITQEMNLAGFSTVEVGNAFSAEIAYADVYSVLVTVDDNVVEYLNVFKKWNTLHIGLKPNVSVTSGTLKARITLPSLEALKLSGAAHATLNGLRLSRDLAIQVLGASVLGGDMEAGNVWLEIAGASTATLKGAARSLVLEVSGASHANLGDFQLLNVTAMLSEASSATVNLSGRLDANMSGASHLTYLGQPTLGRISKSGGSTVTAQ